MKNSDEYDDNQDHIVEFLLFKIKKNISITYYLIQNMFLLKYSLLL